MTVYGEVMELADMQVLEACDLESCGSRARLRHQFLMTSSLALVKVKSVFYIAEWCKGNTSDFDSLDTDSSSVSAAIYRV